jgi:uncharacterized protein with NRDE domain
MCLILIGYHAHPAYPLVIAANRDEYFRRATREAGFWQDYPSILAGRDLEQGGTWLGVDRTGRFAAVTNYRAASRRTAPAATRSRGLLVRDYLTGASPAREYLALVAGNLAHYDGFNLFAGDPQSLAFIGTAVPHPRLLPHGVHGISNGDLDAPWPKVLLGKARIARLLDIPGDIDTAGLFELLADRSVPNPVTTPATAGEDGDSLRMLAPIFVHGEDYGTRCSTVLLYNQDGTVRFMEKSFDQDAMETGTVSFEFTLVK